MVQDCLNCTHSSLSMPDKSLNRRWRALGFSTSRPLFIEPRISSNQGLTTEARISRRISQSTSSLLSRRSITCLASQHISTVDSPVRLARILIRPKQRKAMLFWASYRQVGRAAPPVLSRRSKRFPQRSGCAAPAKPGTHAIKLLDIL